MKRGLVILAVSVFVVSGKAQNTNGLNPTAEQNPPSGLQENRKEKDEQLKQHRLLLMERELKKIGVTEEEKAQIMELQKRHRQKMKVCAQQIEEARQKLSELLDNDAPMEIIETAIQEVSSAQTEQLRILVDNRIQMEKILGKEKYRQFMNNARKQYHKHGRRGGPPLPPRPKLPPVPGEEQSSGAPPAPAESAASLPPLESRPL